MELRGFGDPGVAPPLTKPAWFWPLLIGLCLFRLWAASRVSLLPDEAYYWVWSRAPAAGYFDHPPMVALWIRFGTAIAGETELGVRLLGPISVLAASWLMLRAARDLLPDADPTVAMLAALMMNATLLWGVADQAMTPDVPLLFFWVLALWAMGRLVATGRGSWWLAVGLAAGAAMASKYTALLLPIGILLWLLERGRRFWWRSPWLYGGGGLALALFAPVLGWNAAHHWASFVRQGGRVADFALNHAFADEAELILSQFAIATPIIAVLCAIGAIAAARRWRDPAFGLLAALIWPGVALFVEHALGDRVEANWPAVIFPAAVLAAAHAGSRWAWPGTWLGLALGVLILLQLSVGLVRLPRGLADLPTGPSAAEDFAAAVVLHGSGARYIATDDYGLAALLAWYLPGKTQVLAVEPRWREFDLPPAAPVLKASAGVLMVRARAGAGTLWTNKTLIARIPSARGRQAELLYSIPAAAPGASAMVGAVMPRREKIAGD